MTQYQISFLCPADKVGTIVGLVASEVTQLVVTEVAATPNVSMLPPPRKKNSILPRPEGRVTFMENSVLAFMQRSKLYSIKEIEGFLKSKGYSESSASAVTSRLLSSGYIEKPAAGMFRKREPYTPPAYVTNPKIPGGKRGSSPIHEQGLPKNILTFMKESRFYTVEEITEYIVHLGYQPTSARTSLNDLRRAGFLERKHPNQFRKLATPIRTVSASG